MCECQNVKKQRLHGRVQLPNPQCQMETLVTMLFFSIEIPKTKHETMRHCNVVKFNHLTYKVPTACITGDELDQHALEY